MSVGARVKTWLRQRLLGRRSPAAVVVVTLIHIVSLSALFLILTAAVVAQRIDPFYRWIEDTPLERLGHYVVGFVNRQDLLWRRRLASIPLLEAETLARDALVKEIERTRPTHGVVLRDGMRVFGRLERAKSGKLRLEYEDEDGVTKIRSLTEADIAWSKAVVLPPIELLPRDVRFLLNYPGLKYHYLPPYLFVTDAPYRYVYDADVILGELAAGFLDRFRVLATREESGSLLYVCFFRDETTYLRHAIAKEDVDLERSVGFYSQTEDCLFVYDRLRSFARVKIDRYIDTLATEIESRHDGADTDTVWRIAGAEKERAHEVLRQQAVETLRHEGAHQLAFSLGVHSPASFEILWVEEGLAQYCESVPIGLPLADKLVLLQTAAEQLRLIPWQELIDTPTPTGFSHYEGRVGLAYAQSWFLFYHLMQERHRARFLNYLDRVRRMRADDMTKPQSEILAECLDMTFVQIGTELNATLNEGEPRPK